MKRMFGDTSRDAGIWRFSLGFLQIALFMLLLGWLYRLLFAWVHRASLEAVSPETLLTMLLRGLQFDLAVVAFLLAPALLLYHLLAATAWSALRYLLIVYLAAISLLVPLVGFTDLQYFEEAGKHLTYEATAYLDISAVPIIAGAFELHPIASGASLLACVAVLVYFLRWLRRLLAASLPTQSRRRPAFLLALPLWLVLVAVSVRGGLQPVPIGVGHCSISGNPYVNGFCLNPLYSVLATTVGPADSRYDFFDEQTNTRRVRTLLGSDPAAPVLPRYPMLRKSPGSAGGNRKNVVLFILESWTGKDVAGLGGDPAITPAFARLAGEGLLFTRFHANGIRTAEGIFSILSSFPNQPHRPVLNRPFASQVRWRSLGEILGEAGYETMFLHGRSLDFDHLGTFLKGTGFQHVIDREDFPASIPREESGWVGYHDEQVMRFAVDWLDEERERPFLGVIYTMDTHPPFRLPADFPLMFEPDNLSRRYLNSLHYSDHSLQVFFDLVRDRPWFEETIFILVSDHSRTRDNFTIANQHHIPFLIYAPGYVEPGVDSTVASQMDIVPTVLGLLDLSAAHASFGRDLTATRDTGFAMAIAGGEARWHQDGYLLNDALTQAQPFLCDKVEDPRCETNLWERQPERAALLQQRLRSYLSLSQTLLFEDRVYPRDGPQPEQLAAGAGQ